MFGFDTLVICRLWKPKYRAEHSCLSNKRDLKLEISPLINFQKLSDFTLPTSHK
jgi:hypothetical protein